MVLLALLGCSSWIDQPPACKYDCYEWSDDLLAHIMTGPGDGSFDYDPADTPRQRIAGDYKLGSGEFYWDVTYADAYWVDATHVDGYGTAYHNGDLDVLYSDTSVDMLGEETVTWYRVYREGCEMRTQTWTEDDQSDLIDMVGSYQDDDSFRWSYQVDEYLYQGGFRRNLSSTWQVSNEDNSVLLQWSYKPEGTAEGEQRYPCSIGRTMYQCDSLDKIRFDGSQHGTIEVRDEDGAIYLTVTYDVTYEGVGSERYDYADGDWCEFTYDSAEECDYTCSDGSTGAC